MAGKDLHYFARGNTAMGSFSLYEANLSELEKVFILKGGTSSEKSAFMNQVARQIQANGLDVERIHSSFAPELIEGIICPSLQMAIVDQIDPHIIGVDANEQAYQDFAEALAIHDEWEKVYITNTNFTRLNELTEELKQTFFGDKSFKKQAKVFHRFLGAATPIGAVDFVPNLTEDVLKRYFLKGRPGSGKSTLLKKLASAAENGGFDVEVYHCGFDPYSLDMLIFRELGIAIFDSTAPHEYYPSRDGDQIIDLYAIAIQAGTDEMYKEQINDIAVRYRTKMNDATASLAGTKKRLDEKEEMYQQSIDELVVDQIQNYIDAKIQDLA